MADHGRPAAAPARRTPGHRSARRPARAAAVTATALLTAVTALAGCGTASSGDDAGTVTVVPEADREKAVAVTGTTLDGDTYDVAQDRGSVVVVNVWGSWCGPCRKEAADLQAAYTDLKDDGVVFVGINTRDDDTAAATAYEEKYGITYPSVVDEGGTVLLGLRGAVSPSAVPSTLVLDTQGRVAARVTGVVDRTTVVGLVQDVQAETTDAGS